jgi:AmmeMemoRadiSam system protein B
MALYPAGQWRTPLGMADVDEEMNARLLDECSLLREDHAAHQREHSLEVQVPFLQVMAGDLRFAAICVGTVDLSSLQELGHALARFVQSSGEPVLIVVSSDMNHFESAEVNKRKDGLAIQHVIAVDPEGLHRVVCEEDISMCGFAPAVASLVCCRDMGATKGQLVRYSHSGEVTGDSDEVVSYAGMLVS